MLTLELTFLLHLSPFLLAVAQAKNLLIALGTMTAQIWKLGHTFVNIIGSVEVLLEIATLPFASLGHQLLLSLEVFQFLLPFHRLPPLFDGFDHANVLDLFVKFRGLDGL